MLTTQFTLDRLRIDPAAETGRIVDALRGQLRRLRRKGVVLGLSGGIDSSVTAALCVEAIGPERVLGLLMPERDCSSESVTLGRMVAEHYGVDTRLENIGPTLDALGCYAKRDAALRRVLPEYQPAWRWKIALPSLFEDAGYRIFHVVARDEHGREHRRRIPLEAYQEIVAATNFKQRVRKMMEYYHADRLRYAVAGTPNRLEHDQGFFVKNGDGSADVKPIAHLLKGQVYQLAEHLGVPEEIRRRPPTTDTYSLEQTQEEFFFSLPYEQMDACLWGREHAVPESEVADACGLSTSQVERVYADIDAKRRAAEYLHARPLLVDA